MTDSSNPAAYFGRQVRKSRLAHGWSLTEFGQRIGYDAGAISRVENGRRPPTETFARVCDQAFPERDGWFSEFFSESRGWLATPSWFRSWAPHEQGATALRIWTPMIVHGLLQTEDYARALMVAARATNAVVAERTAARMERQRAVLLRDEPPSAWFLVDAAALRRRVGSSDIMAAQLRHLTGLARLPHVTIQVVPEIEHAGLSGGGFVVAGTLAAYSESSVSGHVFEDDETVSALLARFDNIRAEALRASDTLALLDRWADSWTGGHPPIQAVTGETA